MRWIPLEANPEVMNKYLRDLGVKHGCEFVDVYGLDSDSLKSVPKPVFAVLLLYPLSHSVEEMSLGEPMESSDVVLIKQVINNACGTIALLHSIANNQHRIKFEDDSFIADYLRRAGQMSSEERGALLEHETKFSRLHERSATQGQTEAPSPSESTVLHFICFVENSGSLYELDGRKKYPVCHGRTSAETLLEDTSAVIQKFVARDPGNVNFSVLALCQSN